MDSRPVFHKPTFDNISSEKKQKILSVSLREFSSKGFESANINTIAKEAGVSVGSMYKYFDSKKDLFLTTVHLGIETLEGVLDSISAMDCSVMQKLEKLVRTAVDYSKRQSELIRLYYEIAAESNAELIKELAVKMEAVSARVYTDAIKQGQEKGEIRRDISPEIAAFLLDNLIMMIQFSYSCEYYSERLKVFAGEDIFDRDEEAIQGFLKFVKAALS
ncbi:MAG: TetR/AcrR family transcriptional regulator [Acutalibacteraceae bacterium]